MNMRVEMKAWSEGSYHFLLISQALFMGGDVK
jgi:hypothetical protein